MKSPWLPRLARRSGYSLSLLTILAACSDDPCEADKRRVERCNRRFKVDVCSNEESRCAVRCTARLSCDQLDDLDRGKAPPAWASRCWAKCQERLTCDGGRVVPDYWQCDAVADCIDGADELDCEYFECADGQLVRRQAGCDGYSDCQDGSDERDCGQSCAEDWSSEVCS